jgi:hypothetical protein
MTVILTFKYRKCVIVSIRYTNVTAVVTCHITVRVLWSAWKLVLFGADCALLGGR